jgi:hypothetical protein
MIPETSHHPDEEWIATIPFELQSVARKHGRAILSFVMQRNSCQGATELLGGKVRGNMQLTQSLNFLVHTLNDLGSALITARGWSQEQLLEVNVDVTNAILLANQPQGQRSSGGIILTH